MKLKKKTQDDQIRLTIKCAECGSSEVSVNQDGYHCAKCGSFNLLFGEK